MHNIDQRSPPQPALASHGLWSLWGIMINFQVFGLCNLLWLMRHEENSLDEWIRTPAPQGVVSPLSMGMLGARPPAPPFVPDADMERIKGMLGFTSQLAEQLELQAVRDRIETFTMKLRHAMRFQDFVAEIRVLRETLETGLNFKYFYCYPQEKALVLLKVQAEWEVPIRQFDSAKNDVAAAVDCWALGHSTASVFHLMRIAEYGLRALARERRVKLPKKQILEWADWRTVIDGIGKKVELIANKKRGPARDDALEFYKGALASFEGFKDAYRNNVMHARKSYNSIEALGLMHHVRDFMSRLGSKIDEEAKKQIKWGI